MDNKSISRIWTAFVIKAEGGYMLKFESNESILEDIYFGAEVVVEDIDIFDPINKDSPILYPVFDLSDMSTVPYGVQEKYSSNLEKVYRNHLYKKRWISGTTIKEDTLLTTILMQAIASFLIKL